MSEELQRPRTLFSRRLFSFFSLLFRLVHFQVLRCFNLCSCFLLVKLYFETLQPSGFCVVADSPSFSLASGVSVFSTRSTPRVSVVKALRLYLHALVHVPFEFLVHFRVFIDEAHLSTFEVDETSSKCNRCMKKARHENADA